MGRIWQSENRFAKMLEVEKAVALVQAKKGLIPMAAAKAINQKGSFKIEKILEIEKTTRHDVVAFVTCVAERVGPHGRYVHYGMTSSDVLDTALSLQVKQALVELHSGYKSLKKALRKQIIKHQHTLCAGRTHGIHAEPTTFGLKLCGFFQELERNWQRVQRAGEQMAIAKLSGAVGTYSAQPESIEKGVAKILKLKPEMVATQVIPRDRHSELMNSLALLGAGIERWSTELRHLQRTEVNEAVEGFYKGQKGSSAMPHKKNPISAENLTGVARLLRGYALSSMENVALWHERDISHSSVERVIFPDAFILVDYALHRMGGVIENLQVNKERMKQNMDLSQGQLFSSHVLLALVEKGLSREEAYRHVQGVSLALKKGEHLKDNLLKDKKVGEVLTKKELENIFSGQKHLKSIKKVIKKTLGEP